MREHTVKRHPAIRIPVMLLLVVFALTLLCVRTIPVEAQSGRFIDLFTQKGGTGANQSSDMFQPQELVILYGNVTYNDSPVANKLVGFHVNGPPNAFENLTIGGTSTTNIGGMSEFSFRIPWPSENPEKKVFGEWYAVATVDIADEAVLDTLTFQVGWIIKITNIATLNALGKPEENYVRQSTTVFDLTVENSARTAKPATITIDVQDSKSHPIIHIQLDNLVFQPGVSHVNASARIPADATVGQATVSAAAYTAPVERDGVLYSPPISTTFEIVTSPPLTYLVTFAQTGLDSTATGTVVTVNGTSKGFADMPFTVWVDNGSSLSYSYSTVSSSVIGKRFILTGVAGPSSPMTVTDAVTVTGNYTVQIPLPEMPHWIILAILFGLVLIGALVLLLLLWFLGIIRRRRRKKSARHSYVVIVHPHI